MLLQALGIEIDGRIAGVGGSDGDGEGSQERTRGNVNSSALSPDSRHPSGVLPGPLRYCPEGLGGLFRGVPLHTARMRSLSIMLAEDNARFAAAVSRFLGMLPGARVVGLARDGSEALSMARALTPDLLLLDIAMPGVDGLEVARQMQQWPSAPQIVFLSLNDNAAYRDEARRLGALDFVNKTDFVDQLPNVIARLVETDPA